MHNLSISPEKQAEVVFKNVYKEYFSSYKRRYPNNWKLIKDWLELDKSPTPTTKQIRNARVLIKEEQAHDECSASVCRNELMDYLDWPREIIFIFDEFVARMWPSQVPSKFEYEANPQPTYTPSLSYTPTPFLFLSDDKNTVDLSGINEKSHEEIIENPKLFWGLFCKNYKPEKDRKNFFDVVVKGETLTISGKDHIIKPVESAVEKLRLFFVDGYRDHKVDILLLEFPTGLFFEKNTDIETIDLRSKKDVSGQFFNCYIKPFLPNLANSLGATYSEAKVIKRVMRIEGFMPKNKEVDVLRINW